MVGATRPSRLAYSLTDVTPARTIWVYRNGDPYYLGRKFVINHRYVPNFEAFMIQLNEGVPTPFGVRNIYTPRQGHSVTDLPDLQQGGRYVVAGRERFKKLNYFNIGVKKPYRKKEEVIRPVVHSNIQVPSKWQSIYNKPRNINVFTNGDMLIPPIKILIPKFTLKNWNGVLGVINEKVCPRSGGVHRLYTLNGHCVHGPDDLEDNQFYVGCSKEKFKHLPYWQHPKVPEYIRRAPDLTGQGIFLTLLDLQKSPIQKSDDMEPSVYKAQQSPREIEGAQEIQDDKNIQVEVPFDQVPAEVVQEEDIYSNVGAREEEPAEEDKGGYYEKEETEEEEEEEKPAEKTVCGLLKHFSI
ncbi:hypothetical protein JD844_023862 [Phrynosoma platyrhinos]|uniref:Doublecortin domain-containing protein n=1 Tax=Phrynosoma platyrhinos TaxID=52577 RepID=A0ABQ7SXB6_PHRPL|nr:hypothetical protein JD844_023862 [Phrynosoma platyrhinos]